MKTLSGLFSFSLLLMGPLPSAFAQKSNAIVNSPEVHPDGRVTFRLEWPTTVDRVTLAGEWDPLLRTVMTKGADGIHSVTIGPLKPDLYQYSYWVDGKVIADPHNMVRRTGMQPYQNGNWTWSLFEVPGPDSEFHQLLDVPHGTLRLEWYPSKLAGHPRRLHVYTPPGYDSAEQREYPVLYLWHGAGELDGAWTTMGRANWIMDNLLASGAVVPMIVVMPEWFGAYDSDWPSPEDEDTDLFQEVIPFIEARYKVGRWAGARAIAGASAGGSRAFDKGMRRLDMFSHIGVFSMSPDPPVRYETTFEQRYADALANVADTNSRLALLWMGCGQKDSLCEPSVRNPPVLPMNGYGVLDKAGIKYTRIVTPGGHSWQNWRLYLRDFAVLLFR